MITPMQKVYILIYHRALQGFLERLRYLGMVHIDIQQEQQPDRYAGAIRYIGRIKSVLKNLTAEPTAADDHTDVNPHTIVADWEQSSHRADELNGQLQSVRQNIQKYAPWGDFDPDTLRGLREAAGITVRLFIVHNKHFEPSQWKHVFYSTVRQDAYYRYVIVFQKDTVIDAESLRAEEVIIPDSSLAELRKQESVLVHQLDDLHKQLTAFGTYRRLLEAELKKRESALEFKQVSEGLSHGAADHVFILKGWIPRNKKDELASMLNAEDVAYHITAPDIEDPVPVKLNNSRFSRLFEPITRLFDLPKYREIDLTPFFAPFFTLFFGFALADAGYGIIIFIISMVMSLRVKSSYKKLCYLGVIMGLSTSLVGLITGTVFGIDTSTSTAMRRLVIFNQNQLFYFSLLLGFIQVIYGMIIKVINTTIQFGFKHALPTVGWLSIITGGILYAMLDPRPGYVMIGVGVSLILFFNDFKSNIFIRLGKGLWELYGITGIVGDVLSYVRIFALGLSSSILGFVINDIAGEIRAVPVAGFVLAFVFLVFGHTTNLLLSSLSSFVHPLRLTFVEFYKNAGFSGGGREYKPFTTFN
ncbi:MAG: hypothetical protein GF384_07760 [Elusimicrobia bacterium]|nr:hypothetical protein [Elusimicrobiota bacterium]MBD3412539.1 hypothetical protein [Elusimicrobiota bacterium]